MPVRPADARQPFMEEEMERNMNRRMKYARASLRVWKAKADYKTRLRKLAEANAKWRHTLTRRNLAHSHATAQQKKLMKRSEAGPELTKYRDQMMGGFMSNIPGARA